MDPIADMLTRIRNGSAVAKTSVVMPYSKMKETLAALLLKHGFLTSVDVTETEAGHKQLTLGLRYDANGSPKIRTLKRISSPGLRIYRGADELPKPRGGFGIVVVSTPKGVMTTDQARRARTGGELICEVLS